jgi:hypothetical protein
MHGRTELKLGWFQVGWCTIVEPQDLGTAHTSTERCDVAIIPLRDLCRLQASDGLDSTPTEREAGSRMQPRGKRAEKRVLWSLQIRVTA